MRVDEAVVVQPVGADGSDGVVDKGPPLPLARGSAVGPRFSARASGDGARQADAAQLGHGNGVLAVHYQTSHRRRRARPVPAAGPSGRGNDDDPLAVPGRTKHVAARNLSAGPHVLHAARTPRQLGEGPSGNTLLLPTL